MIVIQKGMLFHNFPGARITVIKFIALLLRGRLQYSMIKKNSLVQGKVQGYQWQGRPSCRQQELPHCQPGSSISPPVACMKQAFFLAGRRGDVTNPKRLKCWEESNSLFWSLQIYRIFNFTHSQWNKPKKITINRLLTAIPIDYANTLCKHHKNVTSACAAFSSAPNMPSGERSQAAEFDSSSSLPSPSSTQGTYKKILSSLAVWCHVTI